VLKGALKEERALRGNIEKDLNDKQKQIEKLTTQIAEKVSFILKV
jgi:hypothetical protein